MALYAIWVDRRTAQCIRLDETKGLEEPHSPLTIEGSEDFGNFDRIVQALFDPEDLLIVGPGVAKHHFRNFLQEQYPKLAKKVRAIETMIHPSRGEILGVLKRLNLIPV